MTKPVPRIRPYVRVTEAGCWIWQLGKSASGYGWIGRRGRIYRAHRHVYELATGLKIPPGLQIDHLCGQRACVNPAHLEPVTNVENIRRSRVAKLTMDKARQIRALAAEGVGHTALAERFGCSRPNVIAVLKGHSWREAGA